MKPSSLADTDKKSLLESVKRSLIPFHPTATGWRLQIGSLHFGLLWCPEIADIIRSQWCRRGTISEMPHADLPKHLCGNDPKS